MKKIYSFLAATCCIAGSAFAQQPVTQITPVQIQGYNPSITPQTADTITTYLDRATGFYNLSAGAAGYVLGTSNVQSGTGCHYTSVGSAHATEVMVYFAHKTIVNTPDNISAEIMYVGADSMPTTLVSSGSVNIANADVNGFPTFIPMTNYPNYSGDFFVAIRYGNIDDTIVIMSTNPTTDGANEKRVRQNTTGIFWSRAYDIWTVGGQPYNADALIMPVMDIAAGIDNSLMMNGFTMQAPFPSPANDLVTIPFSVGQAQDVKLTVFNQLGQPVKEENFGCVNGSMNYQLDISGFAAGTYYYSLSGLQGQVVSKFVVAK
jgi:hypothetical protein